MFEPATQHTLPLKESLYTVVNNEQELGFLVTEVPDLLGRSTIRQLDFSVDKLVKPVNDIKSGERVMPGAKHQLSLKKLCGDYAEIFESCLGLIKDFELDVKFKDNAKPVFMKPRPVPFAFQEEGNEAYDACIKKGVWKKETNFSLYGTSVVPIWKNVSGKFKK